MLKSILNILHAYSTDDAGAQAIKGNWGVIEPQHVFFSWKHTHTHAHAQRRTLHARTYARAGTQRER